ncbi:MAG: HAD-IA family hydrolase [Bacteroidota bacterium]
MDKIKTVIFDIGGVLVNVDFDAFPRLVGIERNRVNPFDVQAIERMAREYEIGRIGTEEFFGMMDEIFKGKFTRKKLENAWNATVVEENSAIVPIVDAIQTRHQIAILSNTNPTHFQKSCDVAAIIKKFSKFYLSFQIGASKPDEAVYQYVIQDLSVEPSSLLFIDDIAENVLAANKCGMKGIIFKSVSQLQTELRLHKI